jgi:HAD superfamily hydrolase (TIGR01450 family)
MEAALRHRAVFFDSFGVLRTEESVVEGAAETIAGLKRQGILTIVVSNDASRTLESTHANMTKLGLPFEKDEIVNSGITLVDQLKRKGLTAARIAVLGTDDSVRLIASAGATPVRFDALGDEVPSIIILTDTAGWDWQKDIDKLINLLRRHPEIVFIQANPDFYYAAKPGEIGIASGSLGLMIEKITGRRSIKIGKPFSPIFEFAFQRARTKIPDLKPEEVLMVGDTLETDILGGNRQGYHTLLVLSGNTPKEHYRRAITRSGIVPYAVAESIAT